MNESSQNTPAAGCTGNNGSRMNSWQKGKEPVPQVTRPTSELHAPLQSAPTGNQGHQPGLQNSQHEHAKGKMSRHEAEAEQRTQFSSSLFSSGHQRAGDSVITSRISHPPLRPVSSYCPTPHSSMAPQQTSPLLSSGKSLEPVSTQMLSRPQVHPPMPTPVPRSIKEALDKLDAELEGHMKAEERKKRDREEKERKRRIEERQRKDLEIRQKQDEERRKEMEKAEEERKRRELDRREKEKRRKEWERQEQEKKRRQEEEEKRRELERVEKKKREWEKQEREKKRKEWERQEEERRKKEAERQEHEKKKMEEKQKQRELKRKEEEKRRVEQQKEKELCSKGKEQTAVENLERLQSGSSEPKPPPPRLSAASAPPSDRSPPRSQASPTYPWLSRGGVLPCPAANATHGPTSAERLRPPPLTPQTEYAREKQRQREMSSGGVTFSPLSTHNTSGINQLLYPNKPPAMQPAPDQSKDSVKERDGGQHSLPSMALREPPKLYQAFPREALPPPPVSSSTRGVLNKQMTGSPDDGAQFEEEPSELSTLLPDGLANIMAMLDESIKKEEELYNSEKSSTAALLDNFPPGIQPAKRYLSAPDLIPATKHQPSQEDLGCNPHASPPVLSRQGSLASPCSRTSSLNEEEEDYIKPLPSISFSQSMDARMMLGNTNYRHSDLAKLYGLPEQTKSEADEEYDDDSETPSCSPPPQRPHLHQTGLNSTFKSLATVLESQKYTYRGGPFGRPPPSALIGVKYSSSLSLGPDICRQQQGSSPTSDSTNPVGPAVPPFKSSHYLLEDKKLKLEDDDSADWKDEETEDAFHTNKTESSPSVTSVKVIKEEQLLVTISETSLAELSQSCEVMHSRQSLPNKNSMVKTESHDHPDDRRKPDKVKEHKDRNKEKEKKKHGHGSKKHEERKEKKHKEKREMASSSSSSHSSSNHKRHKDGKSHKEKDRRILGDLNLQSKERAEKNRSHHCSDKKKRRMASTSSSTSEGKSDSGSSLGPTDFLKLKALSDGPPKELKIRLIKVESGDRETFIASEVEEKRIPLEEIGIKNTASEIIRSCK